MPLSVSSQHKTTITVDGESIGLLIKRMTIDEWAPFQVGFLSFSNPVGTATMDETESLNRRRAGDAFAVDNLALYLAVEAGCIRNADTGEWVTTGAEFARFFGARDEVIAMALAEVYIQNRFPDAEKKTLSSRRALRRSSKPSDPDGGKTPAPTAAVVESSTTAPSEGATA